MIKYFLIIVFLFLIYSTIGVMANDYISNYDGLRIENEDKLVVPKDKSEAVWSYMVDRLVSDKDHLKSLNPEFDSYHYDEMFNDIYFDTPKLQMLNQAGGVRYRVRENLDDPDHQKSGRQLLQVKISDLDDNALNRGEIKFDINSELKPKDGDDFHPVIGLIEKNQREDFKTLMENLSIDPYALKKVIALSQLRQSIYITLNGEQFMSIRLDHVSSRKLWFIKWRHIEIEPELNEVPYTNASPEERQEMEKISNQIVDDILNQFPEIQRDLTPKYNKAFNYFESKIPFFRFLIRFNII